MLERNPNCRKYEDIIKDSFELKLITLDKYVIVVEDLMYIDTIRYTSLKRDKPLDLCIGIGLQGGNEFKHGDEIKFEFNVTNSLKINDLLSLNDNNIHSIELKFPDYSVSEFINDEVKSIKVFTEIQGNLMTMKIHSNHVN